jgi:hypothetical protein
MDITAANAILIISVPGLFPVPQQIQQFAADDVYDLDEIESVETLMGVDGKLSGGFVWKPQPQTIMLQADSPSNDIFDTWQTNQIAGLRTYIANGVLTIPNLGIKFIQTTGYLSTYKLPGAKRLMQPRRFRLTWQQVVPAPA